MREIQLGDKIFSYVINYKKIKRIYIRWRGDKFEINAPFLCSLHRIKKLLLDKETELLKMAEANYKSRNISLDNNSTIRILENEYVINYTSGKSHMENSIIYLNESKVKGDFIKICKKLLEEYVVTKVDYYFTIMYPDGVKPTLRFKNVKTYFGQYSKKKHEIVFNVILALVDKELIDYVIVHELCHIKYFNHQADFKKMEEKYLPDYRIRQKRLKKEALFI